VASIAAAFQEPRQHGLSQGGCREVLACHCLRQEARGSTGYHEPPKAQGSARLTVELMTCKPATGCELSVGKIIRV
jgi:hypothetical protein